MSMCFSMMDVPLNAYKKQRMSEKFTLATFQYLLFSSTQKKTKANVGENEKKKSVVCWICVYAVGI